MNNPNLYDYFSKIIFHNNEDNPQILLFEDAELKTTYNMEDLTRQWKGD